MYVLTIIAFTVMAVSQTHEKPVESTTKPPVENNLVYDMTLDDMKFESDNNNNESHDRKRKRRAALRLNRWSTTRIPYQFDDQFPVSKQVQQLTTDSFKHIMQHTCLEFVPRVNEFFYINITMANPSACFSFVGRQSRGMLQLNLGLRCNHSSVIIHEVLHSLGFLHEHSRPDRDQYVIINTTNIKSGAESQFNIYNETQKGGVNLYNISYDKQSILHYKSFTFTKFQSNGILQGAKNEYKTIYSKADPNEVLGNTQLSPKDVERINMHFDCPLTTTTAPTTTTTTTTTTSTSTTTTAVRLQSSPKTVTTTTQNTPPSSPTTNNPNSSEMATTDSPIPSTTNKVAETTIPRRTIVIESETFNLTRFGTPDSATTNYISFYNILVVVSFSIYYIFVQ